MYVCTYMYICMYVTLCLFHFEVSFVSNEANSLPYQNDYYPVQKYLHWQKDIFYLSIPWPPLDLKALLLLCLVFLS